MLTKEQFHKTLQRNGICLKGQKVALGFSGGGDSVALCHLLRAEKELQDFSLELIYIQHNLRADDSLAEEAFVKDFARKYRLPLHVVAVDVKEKAEQERLSIETAARVLRQEVFRTKIETEGYTLLALAHHANDQAESVFMHFLRGAGVDGLCGMKVKEGHLIRPLLNYEKEEIKEYLSAQHLSWVEDVTNQASDYRRNRVRNEVFPYLAEHFNAGLIGTLVENSRQMADLQEYLHLQTLEAFQKCLLAENPLRLSVSELKKQAPYLQQSVVRYALKRLRGNAVNVERKQIHRVLSLLTKQSGRQVDILGGMIARRNYKDLIFYRAEEEKPFNSGTCPDSVISAHLDIRGRNEYIKLIKDYALFIRYYHSEIEQSLSLQEKNIEEKKVCQKSWTQAFDADTLPQKMEFRYPLPGDALIFNAEGNRKALKKFLADQKIDRQMRGKIPVIACGNEIIWVAGGRIAYPYRVTEETKTRIQFTILGRTVRCQKLKKEFQEKP